MTIADSIAKQLGHPGLVDELAGLEPSALTSLLLEVHRRQAAKRDFGGVRKQAEASAAVASCNVDARALAVAERAFHDVAVGFDAVDVAPVQPLGLCSLTGIDQNNVLAAVRHLEVLADPTAALALEACRRRKEAFRRRDNITQLLTSTRVLRMQPLPKDKPGFTQHFRLFALVSAYRGDSNECFSLASHVDIWTRLLRKLGAKDVRVRLTRPTDDHVRAIKARTGIDAVVDDARQQGRNYYSGVLLGIDAQGPDGSWFTPGDGGVVNWSAALLGDQKERLFTSGFGVEFVTRRLGKPE